MKRNACNPTWFHLIDCSHPAHIGCSSNCARYYQKKSNSAISAKSVLKGHSFGGKNGREVQLNIVQFWHQTEQQQNQLGPGGSLLEGRRLLDALETLHTLLNIMEGQWERKGGGTQRELVRVWVNVSHTWSCAITTLIDKVKNAEL